MTEIKLNLKYLFLILFVLLLEPCIEAQEQLDVFNNVLGKEKTKAFNKAYNSYQEFLKINYPSQESLIIRNSQFLKDFENLYSGSHRNWKFPADKRKVIATWEKSGLRKEIRFWPNEKYIPEHLIEIDTDEGELSIIEDDEIVPILDGNGQTIMAPSRQDSSLWFNSFGLYMFALDSCCSSDSLISDYLEVKYMVGDISPSIMASAYSDFGDRLKDPIIIRMIIIEMYYFLMLDEVKGD